MTVQQLVISGFVLYRKWINIHTYYAKSCNNIRLSTCLALNNLNTVYVSVSHMYLFIYLHLAAKAHRTQHTELLYLLRIIKAQC